MMAEIPAVYTVRVRCSNCFHEAEAVIKVGTSVNQTKCENCGCKSLYSVPDEQRPTSIG